jgi:hypothetical protein
MKKDLNEGVDAKCMGWVEKARSNDFMDNLG